MKEFDFKRIQRDLVTRELGPILYEQGFVLSRPVTYTRERRGLMQQFYFRGEAWGETYKLRPWISYRPVYDARPVLCFGTDGIYVNDCLNPYTGFSPIYWDISRADFQDRFFFRFEALKRSIRRGVLPEMNGIHSLTDLIRLYEANGLLFQKRIRLYPDSQNYYKFISQVNKSSGIKRMALIVEEMKGWELPKAVQEHLESCKGRLDADTAADRIFEEYCDKVRTANKLTIQSPLLP